MNRYWNSKESLFAAAMQLPFDPASAMPQLVAPGLDGMGERLTPNSAVRRSSEMFSPMANWPSMMAARRLSRT